MLRRRFVAVRETLEKARKAYRRRAWADAHGAFSIVDKVEPLDAADLVLHATCAYLVGRDDEALSTLERAHQAFFEENQPTGAARCAFWLGLLLMLRGEVGRASGWLARAERLVESEPRECVESGYLMLPTAEQLLASQDADGASRAAGRAAEIGERFADADLTACARHVEGRARLLQGNIAGGLKLLDEAMLAVTMGELSPIFTGLIYCSVIDACLEVYAFSRAREWTTELTRWCAGQPQIVAFTGRCLVHRVQVLQLNGGWQTAMDELRVACDRFQRGAGQRPLGGALYEEGELLRLRGALDAAEEAYAGASQVGYDPHPGLALLRLAQGRISEALAGLSRVLKVTSGGLPRSRVLPAFVEILIADGNLKQARDACDELLGIAERFSSEGLDAVALQTRANMELAEGNAVAALASAKRATELWEQIDAPYWAARARELIGLSCRNLKDEDGAKLELAGSRAVFERLGARPDRARIDAMLESPAQSRRATRLTAREMQVVRLIAAGKTNKQIADELGRSEKTIERHVSHIFQKLDVASRSAATAYVYKHKLI